MENTTIALAYLTDIQILEALRSGEAKALDTLFRQHYAYLCKVVFRVLPDAATAEDLVQEVFYEVWRKREHIQIQTSLLAYLHRSAVNKTLNHIRNNRLVVDDETALPLDMNDGQADAAQQLETEELRQRIEKAIGELPERCRIVFGLSRFEDMSNKAIADHLGISIKTVENQMTKALRLLRDRLG